MTEDILKPDVWCPDEEKRVPVWKCVGSFIQGTETCPKLEWVLVDIVGNHAEVRCQQPPVYTEEEEEKIKERLRKLGYIE